MDDAHTIRQYESLKRLAQDAGFKVLVREQISLRITHPAYVDDNIMLTTPTLDEAIGFLKGWQGSRQLLAFERGEE